MSPSKIIAYLTPTTSITEHQCLNSTWLANIPQLLFNYQKSSSSVMIVWQRGFQQDNQGKTTKFSEVLHS